MTGGERRGGRRIEFFAPRAVGLEEVLQARERRQAAQRALLARWGTPLVSLCMNVPGPVKDTPLIELAFRHGLDELEARLPPPLAMEVRRDAAGPEALLAFRMEAPALKVLGEAVEAEAPVGRLLDVDVLDGEGHKLSRAVPRTCIVCGGPAFDCARSRAHGLAAVEAAARALLMGWAAPRFAEAAEAALLEEARLTPKPGLVDRSNNGAHRDMDLPMLERSARALRPYFERFFRAGMDEPDRFLPLRGIGVEAEAAMMEATGGVNAHRGAIFALGLLLGALGASLLDGRDVLQRVAALAKQRREGGEGSHGASVRARYGAGGAVKEAMAGFPTAFRARAALEAKGPLTALLGLLARCTDTNLLYRGGRKGLLLVRAMARAALCLPQGMHPWAARGMDRVMIRRNLSPGGSADLLALALFMERAGL